MTQFSCKLSCYVSFLSNSNQNLSQSLSEVIFDNKTALDLIYEFIDDMGFADVVFLINQDDKVSYKYRTVKVENDIVSVLQTFLLSSQKNIFFYNATNPLQNASLNQRIITDHLQYKNDFSFAIGYPSGLFGYVLLKSIIPSLISLIEPASNENSSNENSSNANSESVENTKTKVNTPIYDGFLYDVIKKDINAFDVDGQISPIDTRMLRINLTSATLPEFYYLKSIAKDIYRQEIDYVLTYLVKNQKLLYTIPNYYQLQISGDCPFACVYCPYQPDNHFMSFDEFSLIMKKINSVSKNYVINLTLFGEASYNQYIYDMIETLEADTNVKTVVIETTGIGWDKNRLKSLPIKKSRFIVSLDTLSKEKYLKNRVNSIYKNYIDAEEFINFMASNFKDNVYIQTVRIDDYEDEILTFFKSAKEKVGNNVIVQKFSNYPTIKKMSSLDIAPASREHCFHLRREMCIMSSGKVLRCFKDIYQDIHQDSSQDFGNIITDDINDIIDKFKIAFEKDVAKDYCEMCKVCDDYYIYNF